MHFLSLFSCSKCGFTAGGNKKVPTGFPKIDKIFFFWHLFHFLDFIFCLDFIFFCFLICFSFVYCFCCFWFNFNICFFGIRLSVFVFLT